MVNPRRPTVVRAWHGQLAPEGSNVGDQLRNEFLHDFFTVCPDTRLLWLPSSGDTTATTDASRNARTFTYDTSIEGRVSALGSGVSVDFDGTDDEADVPDPTSGAELSFGDSTVDQPFSLLWLGNRDADTSAQTLMSKQNSATVDEWELHLTATNGYATFNIIDASASAFISRSHDTDIGTSDVFIAATYDGSGAATGMRIYKDAARVDDGTGDATGAYIAMENTASLVQLGTRFTTPERFYNGQMALAAVVAKELSIDEVWALKEAMNGYFDLSL